MTARGFENTGSGVSTPFLLNMDMDRLTMLAESTRGVAVAMRASQQQASSIVSAYDCAVS